MHLLSLGGNNKQKVDNLIMYTFFGETLFVRSINFGRCDRFLLNQSSLGFRVFLKEKG